jgi:thioredoxin 1
MIEVNDSDFDETILDSDNFSLVIFVGSHCSGCHALLKEIEKYEGDYDALFAVYSIDNNKEMANKYNVLSLPTALIFKCGVPAKQISGYHDGYEIKRVLDDYFAKLTK